MVAQQPLVMHLLLLLAPALGRLGTRTATNGAIRVTSVTPARFPREIATQLTIDGENFVDGMVVAIDGLSGNLYSADLSVYRPMRALNATVLSPTRAVVTTVPSQNGGPCAVRASPDGAGDWSDKASAPIASVFAAVEFAVGRRPYTVERTGALLARLDPSFWSRGATVSATLASADLDDDVVLVAPTAATAADLRLPFSLGAVPADRVEGNVTFVAAFGGLSVAATRRFSRAVPPSSYAGSIVAVDHETRALAYSRGYLAGDARAAGRGAALVAAGDAALTPLALAGWFNSPFEYGRVGVFDGDAAVFREGLDPRFAGGASTVADWAKRGTTVIRGGDLNASELDALHAVGISALLGVSGMGNATALVEHAARLRDHPAFLGYYICRRAASCGRDDFREISTGKTMRSRHRHAW